MNKTNRKFVHKAIKNLNTSLFSGEKITQDELKLRLYNNISEIRTLASYILSQLDICGEITKNCAIDFPEIYLNRKVDAFDYTLTSSFNMVGGISINMDLEIPSIGEKQFISKNYSKTITRIIVGQACHEITHLVQLESGEFYNMQGDELKKLTEETVAIHEAEGVKKAMEYMFKTLERNRIYYGAESERQAYAVETAVKVELTGSEYMTLKYNRLFPEDNGIFEKEVRKLRDKL